MNKDIQSQLERAEELLRELEKACNDDLQAKDISGRTKNLSQEVLLKVRHVLDQAMYKFFQKYYLSNLSDSDEKSAKVYFPIVSKKEDLLSVLGRAKMGNLESSHQDFYNFIDSIQPYNENYLWLNYLAKYVSEKHTRLTPQKRTESKRVSVSRGGGSISWGSGVTFGNGVSIMGVPIDPATQMPVPNNVAEVKVENWVSFLFEDGAVDVLWLCKKSVEGGREITKRILEFV